MEINNQINIKPGEIIKSVVEGAKSLCPEVFTQQLGIWGDNMKYKRTENLYKIAEKIKTLKEKKPEIKLPNVGMKFEFDFIETASLEDDDNLQTIWANLFYNKSQKNVRDCYINILKNLSYEEINILYICLEKEEEDRNKKFKEREEMAWEHQAELHKLDTKISEIGNVYFKYNEILKKNNSQEIKKFKEDNPEIEDILKQEIETKDAENKLYDFSRTSISFDKNTSGILLDNLIRMNLIEKGEAVGFLMGNDRLQTSNKYRVNLTDLGTDFIEACTTEERKKTPPTSQ